MLVIFRALYEIVTFVDTVSFSLFATYVATYVSFCMIVACGSRQFKVARAKTYTVLKN